MPRAKVHPENRRRVVQACRQCKASKRKCNASLPCNHCIKRGIADACDTSDTTSGRRKSSSARSRTERQQSNITGTDDTSTEGVIAHSLGSDATLVNFPSHPEANIGTVTSHGSLDVASPDTTRAQMLSNNDGEYVFVGRSASLSFLQLVRETVARCIGSSQFSDYASRDQMLEVDLEVRVDTGADLILDESQQSHCIEYYFLATHGLVDVLTPEEAKALLASNQNHGPYATAIRLLVIAIGVQAGPMTANLPANLEKQAFAQGRAAVFASMLENPSLDMIKAFLLLAFYLLGACHRNAAFLYLGIAARAAHTLGLHTAESYAVLDRNKRSAQLKCWKSIVSLELMVSSILGRTTSILAQRINATTVLDTVDRSLDDSSAELEAVYRLALLVDTISSQFNGQEPVTAETAQAHLQTLKDWSAILPAKLRPATIPENCTDQTRRSMLGCMHISCFYYFTVMLVTRPFLILHATQRLFVKEGTYQIPTSDRNDAEELSSACLNAAIYMAQTCSDLLDHGLLADNMCLLKAWIFAAGLVLGFELFSRCGQGYELEQAFYSCRRVLEKLAAKSPQASQYHEILTSLSSAIERYKRMQNPRISSNSGSLVARIMDLRPQHDAQTASVPMSIDNGGTQEIMSEAFPELMTQNVLNSNGHVFDDGSADYTAAMDDFSLPFAESFLTDLQSFGMMPWGMS